MWMLDAFHLTKVKEKKKIITQKKWQPFTITKINKNY